MRLGRLERNEKLPLASARDAPPIRSDAAAPLKSGTAAIWKDCICAPDPAEFDKTSYVSGLNVRTEVFDHGEGGSNGFVGRWGRESGVFEERDDSGEVVGATAFVGQVDQAQAGVRRVVGLQDVPQLDGADGVRHAVGA